MIKTNNTGTNAQDIDFYTNATQKMTIKGSNSSDDGYVGIDNASPAAVLHVDGTGTTTTTGQVFRTDGPSGSDNQWRMYSGNVASNEKFNITNYSGSSNVGLGTIQGARLDLFTSGSGNPRMSILGSGNVGFVGIGTTSPTSALDIDGQGVFGTTGDVFETNGPTSLSQYWKMKQGGSLKGQLFYNNSVTV